MMDIIPPQDQRLTPSLRFCKHNRGRQKTCIVRHCSDSASMPSFCRTTPGCVSLAVALALAAAPVLPAPAPGSRAPPGLTLTKLGATLTEGQRDELKAAAARVINGGANRWPSYLEPGTLGTYYAPDDHTDPRRHYGSQCEAPMSPTHGHRES